MGTVGVREITAADILVREWPQIHQARCFHERLSLFSKSGRQPPTQAGIAVLSPRQSDRDVKKLTINLQLAQRFKKKYSCKATLTVCLHGVDRDTFFTDYGMRGTNL